MAYDTFTSQPYETNTIVVPQKAFFACDIHIKHWQLRNLISSDEPYVLNYVSGHKIFQLNLNTHKRTLIATLNFEARCSASGYGYICAAGAEDGLLAIIENASGSTDAAEVDQQLPIDFGERLERSKRPPTLRLDQVGGSIINSIAIYKMNGDSKNGTQDDIVAVLTNNDTTVRILSLSAGVETAVLDVAFPVNHATISPDGQTLVAVGDHQQAYFFEKILLDPAESKISSSKYASSHCRWVLLNIVRLHYPGAAGISGYFATAWSPSGALCAVASENGYVTLLDASRIKAEVRGEDCIITVVSSTRPSVEPGPGAIRTLHFSPAPWDLLVWSEGRGRICVADLRYALNTRQILDLNPADPKVATIDVELATDFTAPVLQSDLGLPSQHPIAQQVIQHLRRTREGLVVESTPANDDRSPRSGSRRRMLRVSNNGESSLLEHRDPDPNMEGVDFDARELLQVLTSAGQPTDYSNGPRSIHYRRQELRSPRSHGEGNSRLAEHEEMLADAIHAFRRQRSEGERYPYHPAPSLPRRQASIVMSSEDGQSPSQLAARQRAMARTGLAQFRDSLVQANDPAHVWAQNPWDSSARLVDSRRSRADEDEHNAQSDYRLQRALERAQRLRDTYKLNGHDQRLLQMTSVRNRADGPDSAGQYTAGVVISPDGQKIWAGSQQGIFEFSLNIRGLMNYPSMEAR